MSETPRGNAGWAIEKQVHAWWSPSGWKTESDPVAYRLPQRAEDRSDAARRAAGFVPAAPSADDCGIALSWRLWRHTGGHLLVEVWEAGLCLAEFFVRGEDRAAFFADKYPAFLAAAATIRAAGAPGSARGAA